MNTGNDDEAIHYLRRWTAIVGAWLVATVVLVVWSTNYRAGDGVDTTGLQQQQYTAPTAATVTVEPPAAPPRTPNAPPATRSPQVSQDRQPAPVPAAIVAAGASDTTGVFSECQGRRSIRAGARDWWCNESPLTCADASSIRWNSIIGEQPRWGADYCLNIADDARLQHGCEQVGGTSTASLCVLHLFDAADSQKWRLTAIYPQCDPALYGERIREACFHGG